MDCTIPSDRSPVLRSDDTGLEFLEDCQIQRASVLHAESICEQRGFIVLQHERAAVLHIDIDAILRDDRSCDRREIADGEFVGTKPPMELPPPKVMSPMIAAWSSVLVQPHRRSGVAGAEDDVADDAARLIGRRLIEDGDAGCHRRIGLVSGKIDRDRSLGSVVQRRCRRRDRAVILDIGKRAREIDDGVGMQADIGDAGRSDGGDRSGIDDRRHIGVGADGVVAVLPENGPDTDAEMISLPATEELTSAPCRSCRCPLVAGIVQASNRRAGNRIVSDGPTVARRRSPSPWRSPIEPVALPAEC